MNYCPGEPLIFPSVNLSPMSGPPIDEAVGRGRKSTLLRKEQSHFCLLSLSPPQKAILNWPESSGPHPGAANTQIQEGTGLESSLEGLYPASKWGCDLRHRRLPWQCARTFQTLACTQALSQSLTAPSTSTVDQWDRIPCRGLRFI